MDSTMRTLKLCDWSSRVNRKTGMSQEESDC
jgi:hypothetical protein